MSELDNNGFFEQIKDRRKQRLNKTQDEKTLLERHKRLEQPMKKLQQELKDYEAEIKKTANYSTNPYIDFGKE